MSNLVQIAASKLPVLLGAGILGVSVVGLIAASAGLTLSIVGELASAAVGMTAAGVAIRR